MFSKKTVGSQEQSRENYTNKKNKKKNKNE